MEKACRRSGCPRCSTIFTTHRQAGPKFPEYCDMTIRLWWSIAHVLHLPSQHTGTTHFICRGGGGFEPILQNLYFERGLCTCRTWCALDTGGAGPHPRCYGPACAARHLMQYTEVDGENQPTPACGDPLLADSGPLAVADQLTWAGGRHPGLTSGRDSIERRQWKVPGRSPTVPRRVVSGFMGIDPSPQCLGHPRGPVTEPDMVRHRWGTVPERTRGLGAGRGRRNRSRGGQ